MNDADPFTGQEAHWRLQKMDQHLTINVSRLCVREIHAMIA